MEADEANLPICNGVLEISGQTGLFDTVLGICDQVLVLYIFYQVVSPVVLVD